MEENRVLKGKRYIKHRKSIKFNGIKTRKEDYLRSNVYRKVNQKKIFLIEKFEKWY